MNDYSEFVPNVHFEQIPIRNLLSDQGYQRALSRKHIERAAANFDLYQINPVKVSRRDGINYVFNGQHTIEIVAMVSGSRDTPVWCMIYDELNYRHEADIFANQMKYVKPLIPYEVFVANLEAGNEDQLMIRDLVESYGLKIGPTKGPNVICAVSTIEMIYEKYHYHVLDRVLRLSIGTWEGDANSFSGNMLSALAKLVVTYGSELDDEIFKEKLGEVSVKQISRTAKDRRSGSLGYAEAMVLIYNGKKRSGNRLQMSRLYVKKTHSLSEMDEDMDEDEDQEELLDEDEEMDNLFDGFVL